MGAPRSYQAAFALILAIAAGGCCCPSISGRYGECGPGPLAAAPCASRSPECRECGPRAALGLHGGPGHALGAHRFARQQGPVPSQQRADYVSPPARFHPLPTRPAFEPLPTYPPLARLDAAAFPPGTSHMHR